MREKILRAIEDELRQSNKRFFGYAWREVVDNALMVENRNQKLCEWMEKRIELDKQIINALCPTEWGLDFWDTYLRELGLLAFLVQMREQICDRRCTTEMRKNIEQAVCKVMSLRYWEPMGEYLERGEEHEREA